MYVGDYYVRLLLEEDSRDQDSSDPTRNLTPDSAGDSTVTAACTPATGTSGVTPASVAGGVGGPAGGVGGVGSGGVAGGVQPVSVILRSAEFFNDLYHRFLLTPKPHLRLLCLQAMTVVYGRHYMDIGPFHDTRYIVMMLDKVSSHILLSLFT